MGRFNKVCMYVRYVFYWGGGGGEMAEASEGRVISNFLQIGEGQTCFVLNQGHSSFGKGKNTSCRFYFVYTSKATSQD